MCIYENFYPRLFYMNQIGHVPGSRICLRLSSLMIRISDICILLTYKSHKNSSQILFPKQNHGRVLISLAQLKINISNIIHMYIPGWVIDISVLILIKIQKKIPMQILVIIFTDNNTRKWKNYHHNSNIHSSKVWSKSKQHAKLRSLLNRFNKTLRKTIKTPPSICTFQPNSLCDLGQIMVEFGSWKVCWIDTVSISSFLITILTHKSYH